MNPVRVHSTADTSVCVLLLLMYKCAEVGLKTVFSCK